MIKQTCRLERRCKGSAPEIHIIGHL